MRRSAFLGVSAAAALASSAAPLRAQPLPAASVQLGNEVFLRRLVGRLAGKSVGVITNQTGVTSTLQPFVEALHAQGTVRIKGIFAPEHGFRGDRPAGASVASYVDSATGLTVYSLYGASRRPSAPMLAGIDALLFDIQDVGSRAYTYISTMAYAMQGAAAHGKEFWVLDRPNPTTGTLVEGPVLEPAESSFIGLYPIAMRHGMTVGELAGLFNDRFGIGARLKVAKMSGWQRSMTWDETGLQWVQTSPNIPTWQTTFVYLCTGLIDNAGINNGTGFTKPFFLAGALGMDGDALASAMNARNLPGVYFRSAAWSPIAGFWNGRELHGVELVVFDPHRFLAVRTAVELLVAVRSIAPHALAVKADALDRDWGTASLRTALLAGKSAAQIEAAWTPRLEAFRALRDRYLLY